MSKLFRHFQVAGQDRGSGEWTAPVEVRCWICGVTAELRPDGPRHADAIGLEELTGWARAHKCARMRVNDPDEFRKVGPPESDEE
jgi:hypothetical protein